MGGVGSPSFIGIRNISGEAEDFLVRSGCLGSWSADVDLEQPMRHPVTALVGGWVAIELPCHPSGGAGAGIRRLSARLCHRAYTYGTRFLLDRCWHFLVD